jgi:uncharacterized protein (DUF1501 family)
VLGSGTAAAGSSTAENTAGTGSAPGRQSDIVASRIESSVPTRLYAVGLGGFATHSAEKGPLGTPFGELSDAVSAFQQRISGSSCAGDVVLLASTEFGRRVAAKAAEGTDHGTAGPVFLAAASARGGLVGEQPSLTVLDQGNLTFTTDFRSVYATVLADVPRADPAAALGAGFPRLPLR